jgi:predicted metalloenzyme YecM
VQSLLAKLKVEEQALDAIKDELKVSLLWRDADHVSYRQGETAVFQTQLDAKQKELEPLSKRLNEAQSAVDITRSQIELLMSNATKHAALLQETRTNLAQVWRLTALILLLMATQGQAHRRCPGSGNQDSDIQTHRDSARAQAS